MLVVALCSRVASFAGGTGKLVAIKGNIDGAKYNQTAEEKLFQSLRHPHLKQKYKVCSNRTMSQITERKLERNGLGKEKKVCVLEWQTQSPDLNPAKNLWHALKRKYASRNGSKCQNLKLLSSFSHICICHFQICTCCKKSVFFRFSNNSEDN